MIKIAKIHTVEIFMKSGNSLVLDRVKEITVDYKNSVISSLKLDQSTRAKTRLLVQSIELLQIEAITFSNPTYTLFY
jgi:sporulation protein YlmC with PRC-barrel domain